MIVKVQNMIFNMSCIRYLVKVDNKDGKFFIGVFTNIDDKEFYFDYPSAQRRNEEWERIERDLGSALLYNREMSNS